MSSACSADEDPPLTSWQRLVPLGQGGLRGFPVLHRERGWGRDECFLVSSLLLPTQLLGGGCPFKWECLVGKYPDPSITTFGVDSVKAGTRLDRDAFQRLPGWPKPRVPGMGRVSAAGGSRVDSVPTTDGQGFSQSNVSARVSGYLEGTVYA